jgi:hypothetical protein
MYSATFVRGGLFLLGLCMPPFITFTKFINFRLCYLYSAGIGLSPAPARRKRLFTFCVSLFI